MKNLYALALGMAMIADTSQTGRPYEPKEPLTEDEIKAKFEERMIAQGKKKFIINGETVWHVSERLARKKFFKSLNTPNQ